jgi:L-threonylcarbamoyladenylate synthase
MIPKINEKLIALAIKIFKQGGIVVFPTETAFGVGCRLDSPQSIERLFKIRKRPLNQATPVLIASLEMAQDYLLPLEEKVKNLMDKNWPGALTVIYPCLLDKVPSLVRGGGETLGVRAPNHQTILGIIKAVGVPILGPSANFHGFATPYCFEDLDKEFLKLVDLVLPGECQVGLASTVVDCSVSPWKIIRQGSVKV